MIYDDVELKQIMREFCSNFTVMEALTEKLQEKLLPHFENLGAFELNQADIKKFILLSMPNGEYEDVELANQLPARGRSPEERKVAEKRVKITAKVNRIYNRLTDIALYTVSSLILATSISLSSLATYADPYTIATRLPSSPSKSNLNFCTFPDPSTIFRDCTTLV